MFKRCHQTKNIKIAQFNVVGQYKKKKPSRGRRQLEIGGELLRKKQILLAFTNTSRTWRETKIVARDRVTGRGR